MQISGIQPFTVVDYPDTIACILFTAGCNFRCGYCHNSEFVLPEKLKEISGDFIDHTAALNFLKTRIGKLDGVVISGGEPTMHHDLLDWIATIKEMGFKVKLDSNGSFPDVLQQALDRELLDYVAMDIKCAPSRYKELAGDRANAEAILKSIDILKNATIPVEFRTVAIKGFHKIRDFEEIRDLIKGAQRYRLLKFRPENTLCPAFELFHPFDDDATNEIIDLFAGKVDEIIAPLS